MTAILLREIFADPKASARASIETRTVSEESVRIAEQYIALANEDLETARGAASATGQGAAAKAEQSAERG